MRGCHPTAYANGDFLPIYLAGLQEKLKSDHDSRGGFYAGISVSEYRAAGRIQFIAGGYYSCLDVFWVEIPATGDNHVMQAANYE